MRRLLLFCMILSCVSLFAQKVKTVSAEYTYYAPESMSVEEAKRTALDRAKIQAIADEFGTIVRQSNTSVISSVNGETEEQFFSYGGSDVKGEWIETTGEPKYDISYKDKTLIVICSVKGKAREIVSAGIDFIAKPLRNGTDLRFEGYDFKDGDDLYLYFQAPIDGYLAVYLLDEVSKIVYSILPYRKQTHLMSFPIKANKEYIFFSKLLADNKGHNYVDEYTLVCESEKEFNIIYVLFSPIEIAKKIGFKSHSLENPDYISYSDFKVWLSETLSKDKRLKIHELSISLKK